MLWVRMDGREVEATPTFLAKLVFEGKVDRHSPSRRAGSVTEQPLEQSLGSPECEALTCELQRRIQSMDTMDAATVPIAQLCAQAERLSQWQWTDASLAARFFWVAAWLHELEDRLEMAVGFYDAFLQMPSRERHLRLLAYNNRGVLRLRLGRLDGIHDLARAVMGDFGWRVDVPAGAGSEGGSAETPNAPPPASGLPAACFNLLNLINVACTRRDLLRAVDEELADFFGQCTEEMRAFWLREPSEVPETPSQPPPGDSHNDRWILRDPTYRRLNSLMTRLAAQARGLMPDFGSRISEGGWNQTRHTNPQSVIHHPPLGVPLLSLWECGLPGDGLEGPPADRTAEHSEAHGHQGYTQAASLLLSEEVPYSLTGSESLLTRAEQSALEELAAIEGCLSSNQYEWAKSRLQVQRGILSSLNQRGRLAVVLARVDAQLEKIAHLEAQKAQLGRQTACATLVAEVGEFCTRQDPGRAQRDAQDLNRRLRQFVAQLSSPADREMAGLLDELAARIQDHLRRLRRSEIEEQVRAPLQHLRQNWPADAAIPVPESVCQSLAQCRLHDPENLVEDWAARQEQLDTHQAQHHVHRALSALQSHPVSGEAVEEELAEALRCHPEQWLTIAAWFGWGRDDCGWEQMPDAKPPFAIRHAQFTVDQAGRLLEKALGRIGGDTDKCLRLWQGVEKTLSPWLAQGDRATLAGVRRLARKYLDHWPAGSPRAPGRADPRHPVNRFLESWAQARRLLEAEQSLHARSSRLGAARKSFSSVLQAGLETRDQLQRVATGLYLAQFQEDAPPVQRQVLAGLEAWAKTMPEGPYQQIREQEIQEQIDRVRRGPGIDQG